jgi:hypothetical protein
MNFEELESFIPYVELTDDVKKHSKVLEVYKRPRWSVLVKQPGKYWEKTTPAGGDMVVAVSCEEATWKRKQFKHDDLFQDVQEKLHKHTTFMQQTFAPALARVVFSGGDPGTELLGSLSPIGISGLDPRAALHTAQVLALAEHRRYKQFEVQGGGRFLPARFALGIIFGRWTADEASARQWNGLPGLRKLESAHGSPPRLRDLV